MNYETIDIQSRFGMTIRNSWVQHETTTNRLMVLLPGRGATTDIPIMTYLREIGTRLLFDVFVVTYGFHLTQEAISFDKIPLAMHDTEDALAQVLTKPYDHICWVGKSLGTPIAAMLAAKQDATTQSIIHLTPILDATEMNLGMAQLAIIGTQDRWYDAEKRHDTADVQWEVYDGVNHGLVIRNNWQQSIVVLQEMLSACDHFIQTHHPKGTE